MRLASLGADFLYCRLHEPASLNTDKITFLYNQDSSSSSSKNSSNKILSNRSSSSSSNNYLNSKVWVPPTLTPLNRIDAYRSHNEVNLGVHCVEDDVLLDTRCRDLLPLGLKVRKFFKGYGFFDSEIIFTKRAAPGYKDGRTHDMEVCYRCKYEDGDQEDLNYAQVISLRQLFNNRFVQEQESQELQIPKGSMIQLITDEVIEVVGHMIDGHSLIVTYRGGGGVVGIDKR